MTLRRYVVPLKFPILIQLPFSSVDATYNLPTDSAILAPSCKKQNRKVNLNFRTEIISQLLQILHQLLLHLLGFLGFPGKETDIFLPFPEQPFTSCDVI